jgi:translin
MGLDEISSDIARRLDAKNAAREHTLSASRRAIRLCANAIRALHRGDNDVAQRLLDDARAAIDEGVAATEQHLDVRYAGYLQDAQKEFAEARITQALVGAAAVPTPEACGVDDAPYLGGMADAIGEARRHLLDRLRAGDVARGEQMLDSMEDLFAVLASMDYPDALTGNLRRLTDVARSLIEKSRGDLTIALMQRDLRDALEHRALDALRDPPTAGGSPPGLC